jgi:ribosomal protein S2
MKRFVFTCKGSSEVIGLSDTQRSLKEAIDFFSKIKNLSITDFTKIYDVKEIIKK